MPRQTTLQKCGFPADKKSVKHPHIKGPLLKQRWESRFKPNQSATVRVLGKATGLAPGPIMQACILDYSGSGMRLRCKLPVPCGAQISVDANSTLVLAHVVRCEPAKTDYELGVQITEITATSEAR